MPDCNGTRGLRLTRSDGRCLSSTVHSPSDSVTSLRETAPLGVQNASPIAPSRYDVPAYSPPPFACCQFCLNSVRRLMARRKGCWALSPPETCYISGSPALGVHLTDKATLKSSSTGIIFQVRFSLDVTLSPWL